MRTIRILFMLLVVCGLVGCAAAPTPTPLPTRPPKPTETPVPPTATPAPTDEPTATPLPSKTPFPTPDGAAPERTIADVGAVTYFEGTHGVSGKLVIAGLQTMIIQAFHFDGKGSEIDVRLVKDSAYDDPVAVLTTLDARVYGNEMILVRIPSSASRDTVDSIVIYCPETQEVYATARFE